MVVQTAVSARFTSTASPFLQSTRRTCEGGLFCSAIEGEEGPLAREKWGKDG